MLKLFAKNLLLVLLLMLIGSRLVCAQVKNYQYDGKMPFVQMMLDMMSVMGILDRTPTNGRYGNYGGYGNRAFSNSPWSQPLLNGGGWGGNTPYGNGYDDRWGNPSWGVLPPESYSLDGWVNESWENSSWNTQRQAPQTNNTTPQNNNAAQQYPSNNVQQPGNVQQNVSPLARIAQPNQPYQANQPRRQAEPESYPRDQSTSPLNNVIKQKPCITEFCGLKKPSLNGLWVSRDGEMLGIKYNDYLWSDGNSRHLTGKIKIENEYLVTSVEGHQQLLRFKYKLSGDYLLTMQPDGQTREFTRMSPDQYQYYYQNHSPDYQQNLYPSYSPDY